MRIERLLAEQGGVARRRDLLGRAGCPDRTLDRHLAAMIDVGALTRPRRGLFALPDADPGFVAAASVGGVVTCVSAAHAWGLPLLTPPAELHVGVPRSTAGRIRAELPAGTVIHWESNLDAVPRRSRAAVALAHVVRCLPLPEAVAVLDAAVGRRLVRVEELRRVRPRRGWADHDRALHLLDPRAGSIAESIARVALVRAGFDVRSQVGLSGVGAVDLVVEDLVVVECDGFMYHSGRAEFRNDRRRDRAIALDHGLMVLRFAYEDVVYDIAGFVATVRRAVRTARTRHGQRPV